MVLYLVRARHFTTLGKLYNRGDILTPDLIRSPSVKVTDRKVIKIDTTSPRWLREVGQFSLRVGMPLTGRVKARIAQLEAEKLVQEEAIKEQAALEVAKAAAEAAEIAAEVKAEQAQLDDVAKILAKAKNAAAAKPSVK